MCLGSLFIYSKFSFYLCAERKQSEMQILPSHMKRLQINGKLIRHAYIRWIEKKSYAPLVYPKLSKVGDGVVKAAIRIDASKTLKNHTIFIQVA